MTAMYYNITVIVYGSRLNSDFMEVMIWITWSAYIHT